MNSRTCTYHTLLLTNSTSYINIALRTSLSKPPCFWFVCDLCVAVLIHRIHVLHSKHVVFYGSWCRQWGKAKIQAASAEVIRFVTDSLWNVLLLKAWCPGSPALSHVHPHSQDSVCTHPHTHIQYIYTNCSCMHKLYTQEALSGLHTHSFHCINQHQTHLTRSTTHQAFPHTHGTRMPHMNSIIHFTVVSAPKPKNYDSSPNPHTLVFTESLLWALDQSHSAQSLYPLIPHEPACRGVSWTSVSQA